MEECCVKGKTHKEFYIQYEEQVQKEEEENDDEEEGEEEEVEGQKKKHTYEQALQSINDIMEFASVVAECNTVITIKKIIDTNIYITVFFFNTCKLTM